MPLYFFLILSPQNHLISLQNHPTSLQSHLTSLQSHPTSLQNNPTSLQNHITSLQNRLIPLRKGSYQLLYIYLVNLPSSSARTSTSQAPSHPQQRISSEFFNQAMASALSANYTRNTNPSSGNTQTNWQVCRLGLISEKSCSRKY